MNEIRLYKNYIFCFFSRKREDKFSTLNCAYNRGDSEATIKKNRTFASYYLNKNNVKLKPVSKKVQPTRRGSARARAPPVLFGTCLTNCLSFA